MKGVEVIKFLRFFFPQTNIDLILITVVKAENRIQKGSEGFHWHPKSSGQGTGVTILRDIQSGVL